MGTGGRTGLPRPVPVQWDHHRGLRRDDRSGRLDVGLGDGPIERVRGAVARSDRRSPFIATGETDAHSVEARGSEPGEGPLAHRLAIAAQYGGAAQTLVL